MKIKFNSQAQAEAFIADYYNSGIFTLVGSDARFRLLVKSLCRIVQYRENYMEVEFEQIDEFVWPGPHEGLPPAGTVCEFRRPLVGARWKTATILYVGKKRIFFQDSDGDELSRGHGEVEFRCTRTPEQIATENTLKEIRQLYDEGGPEAIYEAGYRKFEIVEDERP